MAEEVKDRNANSRDGLYVLEEFSNEKRLHIIWRTMTIISAILAVITIGYLLFGNSQPIWTKVLAAVWFLGPSAWFLSENVYLLKPEDVERKSRRMARF